MALVPVNCEITKQLNQKMIDNALREHLGLSMIGTECRRLLQLNHYWGFEKQISARIARLFNVGHDSEAIIIADLAKVGITITREQEQIIGQTGHWKGHIDGVGRDKLSEFLAEFKTHNQSNFTKLQKEKVKKAFPRHYGQVQSYMGYLKLDKALYVGLNKNTSEYYIEWIYFDEQYFNESKHKEIDVVMAESLFPRIGNNNPTWFECKLCDARDQCFGRKSIPVTCRSCQHVDILNEGKWSCSKKQGALLSGAEQREACPDYELADMFKEL